MGTLKDSELFTQKQNTGILTNPLPCVLPALATSPEGTPGLSLDGSEHRNHSSSSSLDAACPEPLLLLQCGLLAVKGLLLSALCVVLCCRCCCRDPKDTAVMDVMEISDYISFIRVPEHLDSFHLVPGCRNNTYSPAPDD
ncbi:trem-like transcript 4 protein [Octodon degus]|uniref:Trem-like transcript 4 protein n=1 Tax=Octodon degus TaxID=10160 RepID=A0A6P6F0K4_OCTDE|nr:trem-like transcript 4 protein [Octodon degus]